MYELPEETLESDPPLFLIFVTISPSPSGSVSLIKTSPVTPLVPLVTVTVASSFTAFVLSVAEGASLS